MKKRTALCLFLLFLCFPLNLFGAVSDYQGVYSGTFTGVDEGRWAFICDSNGFCKGGAWSEVYKQIQVFTGYVSSSGAIYVTWTNGDYLYLEINKNNYVHGSSGNTYYGTVYNNISGVKNSPEKLIKFMGIYEGKFSGDDSGTWRMVIDSVGGCTGSYHSKKFGESGFGIGVVDENGILFAINDDDTVLYGTIDPDDGDVKGKGYNYVYSGEGSLSGHLVKRLQPSITKPSTLIAQAISSTQVMLRWNDNSFNETGFKIECKTGSCSSSNPWKQIATTASNKTSHTAKGLLPNTMYSFRVTAYIGEYNSAYSNCSSAKTGPSGTPPSPSDLTARSTSDSTIDLYWKDKSTNEKGFKIYRKIAQGAWTLIATKGPNVCKYTDSKSTNNNKTTYQYYIKAYNDNGNSPNTSSVIVPYAPTNLMAKPGPSYGTIKLTWTDKSYNETGFEIYRKSGPCSSSNPWVSVALLGANQKSWIDTERKSGAKYSYSIRAYKVSGNLLPVCGISQLTDCMESMSR